MRRRHGGERRAGGLGHAQIGHHLRGVPGGRHRGDDHDRVVGRELRLERLSGVRRQKVDLPARQSDGRNAGRDELVYDGRANHAPRPDDDNALRRDGRRVLMGQHAETPSVR